MKVWILQLMAVLWVAVLALANADQDINLPGEAKAILEMNSSDEDWKVKFAETQSSSIVGLNGLCLAVNRFAPKLVTCNKTATEQKWKFLEDGTIRPEAQPLKCLTVNEVNRRGVVIVIQCSFSSLPYLVWQYRSSDNALVNAYAASSNLVLDLSQSILGPEAQIFILFGSHGGNNQRWYPSHGLERSKLAPDHRQHFMENADHDDIYPHGEPKPIIEMNDSEEDWKVNFAETPSWYIVGLHRLCLAVNRFSPMLVTCNKTDTRQKWKFLPDGTIRAESEPLRCLTANEINERGLVLVIPCNFSSSAYTDWMYRGVDRAIVNRFSGPTNNLVLDLSQSIVTPEAQIFILSRGRGEGNQFWSLFPVLEEHSSL